MKMRTRMGALMKFFAIFFLVQTSIALLVHAATSDPCECPSKDKLAPQKSCGPEPKKLRSNIFPTIIEKAACSDPLNKGPFNQSEIDQAHDLLNTPSNTKNTSEVLDYVSCYISDRPRFCHYRNTLASHIALAAESAALPMAVQSCLFMRETGFKSNLVSPKGAMGYIQFMPAYTVTEEDPVTMAETTKKVPATSTIMNGIIRGSIVEWQANIADSTVALEKVNQNLEEAISKKRNTTVLQKTVNYYEARITAWQASIAAKKVWDKYWEGSEEIPKKVGDSDTRCPQTAFALAAVKQTYDLYLMNRLDVDPIAKENNKNGFSINGMNEQDSAIILGGAYNAGIGGLAGKCAKIKTLDECINKFSKKSETRKYMSSLRSCSTKKSTLPMTGSLQKKCEEYQCH